MATSVATLSSPPPVSLPLSSSRSSLYSNCLTVTTTRQNTTRSLVARGIRARKALTCNALFGIGVPELAVIAGVAALLFGPKKLPEIGKSIGKTVKNFQQESTMESLTDVNVEWNDVPQFNPGTPDSLDIDSDGEDRRERNDYNIEKEAMDFVDEPQVKHNLYPETESDEEAEEVEPNQRKEMQRTIYRRDQFRRGSGELFVRQFRRTISK